MTDPKAGTRERPAAAVAEGPRPSSTAAPPSAQAPPGTPTPALLDFYSLQDEKSTRLSKFFEALHAGRLTTTRCRKDNLLLWPPRAVCPRCHTEDLEWFDLPASGRLYAFSAVLMGAPLGMEADVPFVVGLVDLDGVPLRIFTRIAGTRWEECRIGQAVEFEPYDLPDGRVFYRFRPSAGPPSPAGR